jgi:hypothetical protein
MPLIVNPIDLQSQTVALLDIEHIEHSNQTEVTTRPHANPPMDFAMIYAYRHCETHDLNIRFQQDLQIRYESVFERMT